MSEKSSLFFPLTGKKESDIFCLSEKTDFGKRLCVMKHSVFMTTAYGFAVLLISVIILGIIAPEKKKNNADCHAQK